MNEDRFNTHQDLISHLVRTGTLGTRSIIHAFNDIDRASFVRSTELDEAYYDTALPIGFQQTISQPSTVAFMLELLQPKEGERILDLGSGSGWTTALLGHIIGESGSVIGIERVPELYDFGQRNVQKYPNLPATIRLVSEKLGVPGSQFNKILVSASGNKIPKELLDQLVVRGCMVIPVGNSIYHITKNADSTFDTKEHPGFVFVPLVM